MKPNNLLSESHAILIRISSSNHHCLIQFFPPHFNIPSASAHSVPVSFTRITEDANRHTRMLVNGRNILPLLRLRPIIDPKPLISVPKQPVHSTLVRFLNRLRRREATHQLRWAHRDCISPINLPHVIRFAIDWCDILHFRRLGRFPYCGGHALRRRHDKQATLNFELMRVPQFSFFGWKRFEDAWGHHIFDTEEACVGLGRVVDQALSDIW